MKENWKQQLATDSYGNLFRSISNYRLIFTSDENLSMIKYDTFSQDDICFCSLFHNVNGNKIDEESVGKIQDYLEAWGLSQMLPDVFPYLGAMVMGVFEFALGFYMLFGIHRRIAPTLMLIVMSFMTPLTLWLAISNPISDCGCFGDAVVLTN